MKGLSLPLNTKLTPFSLFILFLICLRPSANSADIFWVTHLGDSGVGSLRKAITDANSARGGEILFSNLTGSVLLNSALPVVTANLRLIGPGANILSISGNNSNRVLAFAAGTSNYISGLTIGNGLTTESRHGAGISNAGTLKIRQCAIRNNTSSNAFGAGIYSSGDLIVIDSDFSMNTAISSGGHNAQPSMGGGIYMEGGTSVFSRCKFVENRASGGFGQIEYSGMPNGTFSVIRGSYQRGGALYVSGSVAKLALCIFEDNGAGTSMASSASGGAIFAIDSSLTVEQCILRTNYAGGDGKGGGFGLYNSTVSISRSSIGPFNYASGASYAPDGVGAGLFSTNCLLSLTNCLIFGNVCLGQNAESDWRGPVSFTGNAKGAGLALYGGTNTIYNSLISSNRAFGGHGANGGQYDPRPPWPSTPGGLAAGAGVTVLGGLLILANSTVAANEAVGGRPGISSYCPFFECYYSTNSPGYGYGAVFFTNSSGTIKSCTIVSNLSTTSANRSGFSGGVHSVSSQLTIQNTISFGNQGTNSADVAGTITSAGYNIIGLANSNSFTSTDKLGVNPLLGSLHDNGGESWTFALLSGSPAIDAGTSAELNFDQRGESRPIDNPAVQNAVGGNGADIGAFESDHVLRMKLGIYYGSNQVVRFTSTSDKSYNLQYNTNLSSSTWHALPGFWVGTGGIISVTNSMQTPDMDLPRFFRAKIR